MTNAGTRIPLSSNLKSHAGSFIEEAESTVVNNPGTLSPEPLNYPAAAAAMIVVGCLTFLRRRKCYGVAYVPSLIGVKGSFPRSWGSRKLCACKMELGRNASAGALATVSGWQVSFPGEGGEV